MSYRVTPHRLLTRNPTLRHCTRTVFFVVHGTLPQRSPLRSGRPYGTFEAAQLHAKLLAQHGYTGWILHVHEYRSVGHESSRLGETSVIVNGWQPMVCRQHCELWGMIGGSVAFFI